MVNTLYLAVLKPESQTTLQFILFVGEIFVVLTSTKKLTRYTYNVLYLYCSRLHAPYNGHSGVGKEHLGSGKSVLLVSGPQTHGDIA